VLSDKRKKIPQTKVYLHFFAGKETSPNIFMSYKSFISKSLAETNLDILTRGIELDRMMGRRSQLR
jgi:hypothetical protein